MRRLLNFLLVLAVVGLAQVAQAASGRVLKVLPHYLDLQGRHALSPSLYDRDAYQARLRQQPELRSGLRYDVQWKGRTPAGKTFRLRVELRGTARGDLPRTHVLEKEVSARTGWSRWARIPFTGEDWKQFGEVTAWRVTLLDGEQVLSQQQSFLW
jgi:hypothetical protein